MIGLYFETPMLNKKYNYYITPKLFGVFNSSQSNSNKISIEDSEMILSLKIKKCFCKPENVEFNPLFEVSRDLLRFSSLKIERTPENGGNLVFEDCESLKASLKENLHPGDFRPVERRLYHYLKKLIEKKRNFQKIARLLKTSNET